MAMKHFVVAAACGLLLALAGGCSDQKAEQPAPQGTASAPMAADQQLFPLTGTVAESFESGGYTYLRLTTEKGEQWVATGKAEVKVGDQITVPSGSIMENFHSRTLDRTFSTIIFASSTSGGSAAPAAVGGPGGSSFDAALQKENTGAALPPGGDAAGMTGSSKAVAPSADVKVEKAEGDNGYTVGQLHAQATQLEGKEVRVRGQVVKVSSNIMGKNWIHLQDGTGDSAQNTHDLVVTSSAVPETNQVVTVEGVLRANKDFGAGYKYDAIVEDAEIVK